MSEIIFTRAAAPDGAYLSRASSEDWQVAVRKWPYARPILLQRDFDGLNYITLDLDSATARTLAHELLHAADVAEAVTQGGADDAMKGAQS